MLRCKFKVNRRVDKIIRQCLRVCYLLRARSQTGTATHQLRLSYRPQLDENGHRPSLKILARFRAKVYSRRALETPTQYQVAQTKRSSCWLAMKKVKKSKQVIARSLTIIWRITSTSAIRKLSTIT
jgi:hypothetical protein